MIVFMNNYLYEFIYLFIFILLICINYNFCFFSLNVKMNLDKKLYSNIMKKVFLKKEIYMLIIIINKKV